MTSDDLSEEEKIIMEKIERYEFKMEVGLSTPYIGKLFRLFEKQGGGISMSELVEDLMKYAIDEKSK